MPAMLEVDATMRGAGKGALEGAEGTDPKTRRTGGKETEGGAGKKKKQLHNFSKKTSMFKMPEAPGAKVGVIGSGKGMTNFGARKKHEYDDGSGQSRGAGRGADMRTGP